MINGELCMEHWYPNIKVKSPINLNKAFSMIEANPRKLLFFVCELWESWDCSTDNLLFCMSKRETENTKSVQIRNWLCCVSLISFSYLRWLSKQKKKNWRQRRSKNEHNNPEMIVPTEIRLADVAMNHHVSVHLGSWGPFYI